jgi:hypothetical protein
MMKIRLVAAGAIAVFSFNCSSIVHGTTQQVKVNSEPAGAAVTVECGDVNNDPKIVTPAVVTLHRKPDHCALKLNKEGFAEKELKFAKSLSGSFFGNILFGGIIGIIVDGANGAMWNRKLAKDTAVVQDSTVSKTNAGVTVAPTGEITVVLTEAAAPK